MSLGGASERKFGLHSQEARFWEAQGLDRKYSEHNTGGRPKLGLLSPLRTAPVPSGKSTLYTWHLTQAAFWGNRPDGYSLHTRFYAAKGYGTSRGQLLIDQIPASSHLLETHYSRWREEKHGLKCREGLKPHRTVSLDAAGGEDCKADPQHPGCLKGITWNLERVSVTWEQKAVMVARILRYKVLALSELKP